MCRFAFLFLLSASQYHGRRYRQPISHSHSSFTELGQHVNDSSLGAHRQQSLANLNANSSRMRLRAAASLLLAFNPTSPLRTRARHMRQHRMRPIGDVGERSTRNAIRRNVHTRFFQPSGVPGRSTRTSNLAMKMPVRRPEIFRVRSEQAASTFLRIGLPTLLAAILGYLYFSNLSLLIRPYLSSEAISVLQDQNQYMQDYVYVIGYLLTIFGAKVYSALYANTEKLYMSLYREVSILESLLEQTTLVFRGRPVYLTALACIRDYIKTDLSRTNFPPAELIARRPVKDPLESIMYLTSVGNPSFLYSTVKSLREARGNRYGAMQRKFPRVALDLLSLLAIDAIIAFPFLGARASDLSETAVDIESYLFGLLVGGVVLVLRIIQELWDGQGGVFNVDATLAELVQGLEEELDIRIREAPVLNNTTPSVVAASRGGDSDSAGMLPPYLSSLMS